MEEERCKGILGASFAKLQELFFRWTRRTSTCSRNGPWYSLRSRELSCQPSTLLIPIVPNMRSWTVSQKILDASIVQPNHSPFSSPVLLMKKIDGSWKFYIDYTELNKCTIKDKFPIPVIDDLLDELYRAIVFQKSISDQDTIKAGWRMKTCKKRHSELIMVIISFE